MIISTDNSVELFLKSYRLQGMIKLVFVANFLHYVISTKCKLLKKKEEKDKKMVR